MQQGAEGRPAARPPSSSPGNVAAGSLAVSDLAFEIIGDAWPDGLDVGTLFAQAAARMGDNVWMGCVAEEDRAVCRVRVGRGPVYSGGDQARFGVVLDPGLLPGRLAADAFHPHSFLLVDELRSPAQGLDSRPGLAVYRVPWRALASRISLFPDGHRFVVLGVLTWMFGYDPDLVRRLLENRLAARGRRLVSAALRLLELGWREAPRFVPGRVALGRPVAPAGAPAAAGRETPRAGGRACGAKGVRGRLEVMSGQEALALGALTAGFTCCVAPADHPAVQRWLGTFQALGGRVRAAWEAAPGPMAGGQPGAPVPFLVEAAGAAGDGLVDGPRVTLRIERVPETDEGLGALAADPFAAAMGCPGSPRPVLLAPSTVEECFHVMGVARRLAEQYRCHCVVLVDAALLGAVQVWHRRDAAREAPIWSEWLGDAAAGPAPALAGARAAGTRAAVDGLLARLGLGTAPLASLVRPPRPVGGETGQVLLVGWGATRGPVEEAVAHLRARGLAVSALHLRVLAPWPRELGRVLAGFRQVVAVDVEDDPRAAGRRSRQLLCLLRAALIQAAAGTGTAPALTARIFPRTALVGPAAVEAWAAASAAAAHPSAHPVIVP